MNRLELQQVICVLSIYILQAVYEQQPKTRVMNLCPLCYQWKRRDETFYLNCIQFFPVFFLHLLIISISFRNKLSEFVRFLFNFKKMAASHEPPRKFLTYDCRKAPLLSRLHAKKKYCKRATRSTFLLPN